MIAHLHFSTNSFYPSSPAPFCSWSELVTGKPTHPTSPPLHALIPRHPDKNNGSEESTAKFKLINTAYMRLTKDRGDDMEDYDAEDMYDDDLFNEFVDAESFFML